MWNFIQLRYEKVLPHQTVLSISTNIFFHLGLSQGYKTPFQVIMFKDL